MRSPGPLRLIGKDWGVKGQAAETCVTLLPRHYRFRQSAIHLLKLRLTLMVTGDS